MTMVGLSSTHKRPIQGLAMGQSCVNKHFQIGDSSFVQRNRMLPMYRQQRQRCSKPIVAAAAPAVATAAAQGTLLGRVTTGVPLLELFQTFTLEEAAKRSSLLVVTSIAATIFAQYVITFVSRKIEEKVSIDVMQEGKSHIFPGKSAFLGAALVSLKNPTLVLLPWACAAFCTTVIASFLDVLIKKSTANSPIYLLGKANCQKLSTILFDIAQAFQDASEVSVVIFFCWFLIAWKQKCVNITLNWTRAKEQDGGDADNLSRIIAPLSTLLSWAIVASGTIFSIAISGFDIAPILAFGSVSTLAVGLAAQSTVTNIVSAFSLYTSRPFIAGDRITLKTLSGSTVVAGTVDKVLPMQCIIITDARVPVYVNNKDVAAMIVINESKEYKKEDISDVFYSFESTLTVRYADIDKVPIIERQATSYLKSHPSMHRSCRVSLKTFDNLGAVLGIKFVLKKQVYEERHWIVSEVMREIERIVRLNGAYLGMEEAVVDYPPLLTD